MSNKQSTTNVNATVLRTAVGSVQDLISKKKKFNDKPHKTGLTKKAARLIIRKKLKTALTTRETKKIAAKMEDSSFALVSAHQLQLKSF